MLSFRSCSYLFQRFSFVLSLSVVLVVFLSEFLVEIPILVLTFLLCFLKGSQLSRKLISLQHKLVSFNSVILFVEICVSTWFTLFVSALTILHSMFLNDGKVVFSQFKIFFKFLRINFCSCVSSRLFCCVVFGWVGLPFSKVGSFCLDSFCLWIFDVSGYVVFLLSWSYIFWCISIILSSENQPFFIVHFLKCI